MFSVLRDERSVELSQGNISKTAKTKGVATESLKLPLVSGMSAGEGGAMVQSQTSNKS